MVAPAVVLVLSIAFQVTAVVLTLRLIPVTGRLKAWLLISAAILLMVVRRSITLFHMAWTHPGGPQMVDLTAEIVAMATSFLLVIGIAYITPLFLSLKQSKEDLAAETERLGITLRSIGDAVITTDVTGHIVLMNGVAEELTGWRHSQASGRPFEEVFHAVNSETNEQIESPVAKVLKDGEVLNLPGNTVLTDRHGTRRIVQDSCSPIVSPEAEIQGAVLVFRDVTEQQMIEQKLLQAQKMESLGMLAGGIAHDFNNVLTAIVGNIELAGMYIAPGGEAHERLAQAEKATKHATDLARQLLTFARGGVPVKRPVGVPALLRDGIMVGLSGSNVKWELDAPPETWAVEIDRGQIQQVLNNLLVNAADAMPDGGTVTVRAENRIVECGSPAALAPGRYVSISVQDQGHGIPAQHLSRIFDPFFSTRNKGRGLGLAIVYSVIRRHGGSVDVKSGSEEGTTFTVHLPATDLDVREAAASSEVVTIPAGPCKILFMDDDALVRKSAEKTLTQLGYDVAFAEHGAQAIHVYWDALQEGKSFDVVIMDLTIRGGMGGVEAIRQIKRIDPKAKAIVSSGYSDDPVMADPARYGFSGAIPKPYRMADMVSAISAVVGGR